MDQHQITQLGNAHRPDFQPTSSYTQFNTEKEENVIRIGIFGCSFVRGSEAGPDQDYPSHLQRLFEDQGYHNVEVLNFGVGAFGVQQSYLLWQYLAEKFNLDYTIFNLYGFHRKRDDTFVMLNTIYAPVHARYVLDGEGLRLIKVKGDDRREASAGYFHLIPRLDYLRFDAKTPPQIRALLPYGRELPLNPFYYNEDRDLEITNLYGRIFSDMAYQSKSFLVLLNDKTSSRLVRSKSAGGAFNSVRTRTEKFTWARSSFFRAPKNHPSALGYYVLAKETRAFLTAHREVHVPDIEILGPIHAKESKGPQRGLSEFNEVFLSFDGRPVATFVEPLDEKAVKPYSFRTSRSEAILDVSGRGNALFISLRGRIPGENVQLAFSVDGVPAEVEVGSISLVGGEYVGVLEKVWTEIDGDDWRLISPDSEGAISLSLFSQRKISSIRLNIDRTTVLRGVLKLGPNGRSQEISWRPDEGTLIATRGHNLQNVDEIVGSDGGDYCITGVFADGTSESWCTRNWRREATALEVGIAEVPPIGLTDSS